MYAVYNYQAGSTQANVLADLVKLVTGETNKANLSANCVQANTTITSTTAAGWTVWDAAAGTNTQCVRALNQDGTTYKYQLFVFSSTTVCGGYTVETWNATTHTGTNAVTQYTTTWDAAGGGYFYVYATSKNIIILPWTTTGYKAISGMSVSEFSRDTTPATYPCHMSHGASFLGSTGNTAAGICRIKNNNATGDTTNASSYIAAINVGAGGQYSSGAHTYRDASETLTAALYKIGVSHYTGGVLMGRLYDVFAGGSTLGSPLDEISYSGTTYVLFAGSAVSGYLSLLVPKG